jgi:hypothetical protein
LDFGILEIEPSCWDIDMMQGSENPSWILEVAESRRGGPSGEEEEEEAAERGGLGLAGGVCRTCILHVAAGTL